MSLTRIGLAAAAATLSLAVSIGALAQKDVAKSRDHPLLSRYPGSHIVEYESNFNAGEFAVGSAAGEPKRQRVEGQTTRIVYFHNDAAKQPSALQVVERVRK